MIFVTLDSVSHAKYTQESPYSVHAELLRSSLLLSVDRNLLLAMDLAKRSLIVVINALVHVILVNAHHVLNT